MRTKGELVLRLAEKHGLSERQATKIVNTVFAEIQAAVLDGNRVTIRDFGTFVPKKTRTAGVKPGSGERWTRPARDVIRFTPHAASGGEKKTPQVIHDISAA